MGKGQNVKYEVVEQEESTQAPVGKKRGRKSKAEIMAVQDDAAVAEAEIALDRRLAVVDQRFGDGQPYDRTRIEIEVGTHMRASAASFLQAGLRLVQLKEHEPHGNFLESIKRIGLEVSVADKMMLTARKLQGTKLANSDTYPNLLPSKLYDIALLDDDQIEDLDEDGAVGQVTMDDIQRMTSREVRAALRKERQQRKEEIEARERVIKEKNDKLDELDRELRGLPQKSRAEVNKAMLNELQLRFVARCSEITSIMSELRNILDEAARLPEIDALQLAPFQDEIVRLGTENVAEDWEALCAVLEDYRPILDGEDA